MLLGIIMSISLELTETVSAIEKKIKKALAQDFNKLIIKNKNKVTTQMQNSAALWVSEQPELQSLTEEGVEGSLNSVFGLYPNHGDSAVAAILAAAKYAVSVEILPMNYNLKGYVKFKFQPSTFLNYLGLNEGHVFTGSADLHWMDWLINQGDTVIVEGYDYFYDNGGGRSGGGIMNEGGAFRVPPEFSGTPINNFITRAFGGREKAIESIMMGLFI